MLLGVSYLDYGDLVLRKSNLQQYDLMHGIHKYFIYLLMINRSALIYQKKSETQKKMMYRSKRHQSTINLIKDDG